MDRQAAERRCWTNREYRSLWAVRGRPCISCYPPAARGRIPVPSVGCTVGTTARPTRDKKRSCGIQATPCVYDELNTHRRGEGAALAEMSGRDRAALAASKTDNNGACWPMARALFAPCPWPSWPRPQLLSWLHPSWRVGTIFPAPPLFPLVFGAERSRLHPTLIMHRNAGCGGRGRERLGCLFGRGRVMLPAATLGGGGGGGWGGVFEYSIIAMARPVQGQAKTGLVRPWTGRGDTFKGLSHASICRSSYSLTQSHARPLGSFLARDG